MTALVVFPLVHASEWAAKNTRRAQGAELGITQRRFAAWTADVAIRNPITDAWKLGSAWLGASPDDAFVQAALVAMFLPASARSGSMLRPASLTLGP